MNTNNTMTTGMAEATRLTHAGQLTEATALIQRLLGGIAAPDTSSHTTQRATEEAIDVPFHVVDSVPRLAQASAHRRDQAGSSATATSPPPDVATSHAPQNSRGNQPDGTPSTTLHTHTSKRAEPSPGWVKWARGLHKPLSRHLPEQARCDIWAGGKFIGGSFTNAAGTRAYKLYIPSGYRGQALPLVVMLHGCTQTPEDFAAGTRMNVLGEKELFFVLYAAQAIPSNQSKCWNWFKEADQHRDRGEPSIIAGMTHHIFSTYHLNARQVYVAGLSAGGAMAAIMGMTYPDLYAAIAVHSGLPHAAAHDLPSAHAAMRQGGITAARQRDSRFSATGTAARVVPTIVFHGDRDMTVHPRNADQVLAQWTTNTVAKAKLRVTANGGQIPDGHAYTRSIYQDASGYALMEQWMVHGAGHGWSGGSPHGSFTIPKGPDASREIVRFFRKNPQSDAWPASADKPGSAR